VELVYNKKLQYSIGLSSFFARYGQECSSLIFLSNFNSRFESINQMIRLMNEVKDSKNLCVWSLQGDLIKRRVFVVSLK
jgi:hypothetical protein